MNPISNPVALASVFADEHSKQPETVFSGLATAGFRYCSVRFFNLDSDPNAKPRHVEDLTNDEVDRIFKIQKDYGLSTTSVGGRIGKVKFSGNATNVLMRQGGEVKEATFDEYLQYCERCFEIANRLNSKLYRIFPFYAPDNQKRSDWLQASVDALSQIVELARRYDLITGVETEANLIAPDGHTLKQVTEKINNPALGIVFDAGNMRTLGYDIHAILDQFAAVLPHLIWFHIKDYNGPVPETVGGHIEEDLLKHFVPCDIGHSGHGEIFHLLRRTLGPLNEKMNSLNLPGFFLELEPHVRGGGQFGGFSGPDGIGVALRALVNLCNFSGISLSVRTFDDILRDRG